MPASFTFAARLSRRFLFATGFFAAVFAFAQPARTGTVEGRVLNESSGRYIDNARVLVEGTQLETLTDSFGQYRLLDVPAGDVRLRVLYVGLAPGAATLTLTPGGSVSRDFSLARPGESPASGTTRLNAFTVTAERESNNQAIAINEQRNSANLKTVVATELVGDLATDNVAEVMKYLPGVTLDGVSEASGVQVRGFAAGFTTVMSNGALVSSASPDPSRYTSVGDFSANSVSRVEVTKVPTPEMPASSLGGTVNLVPKSAFESSRPVFKYRTYVSVHSDEPNIFQKTPGPRDEQSYKGLPSVELSYTLPINRDLGISLNAVTTNQYSGVKNELSSTWRFISPAPSAAAPNVATPAAPYFQSMSYGPQPRTIWRKGGGLQLDWRPAKDHVLSFGLQYNLSANLQDALLQVPTVGSSESSAVVGGQFLTYGPTFTYGATGRGSNNQQKYTYDQSNSLGVLNLNHRYNGRLWQIDGGVSGSLSKTWWRDLGRGHFFNVRTSLTGVSRILFDGIGKPSLANKITALDAAGNPLDWEKLSSYRIGVVESAPRDGRNTLNMARLNLRRSLPLPFEASVKFGGYYAVDNRDSLRTLNSYTFVGPDGIAGTADDSAAPYLDAKSDVEKWRFVRRQEFISSYKVADTFKSNPNYFIQTPAQLVANEVNRITRSYDLSERIATAYIQGEARVWSNRVRILTGVRFEQTQDLGHGPLFDPNGVFQRDAAGRLLRVNGAFVRKPEAGAAGSLQELPFIRRERGSTSDRTFSGYYPSLHLTGNVTANFLVRAAYAETFGRPDLTAILPNTTIGTEALQPAPGAPPGNITVTNGGLKPYSAKNYDLSFEYYFEKGGVLSAGVFRKDLRDFFGTLNTLATPELLEQFGLDPGYVGWNLQSQINVGSARISGVEFNYSQSLAFLPWGGRYLNAFANYTRLQLEGSNETDFTGFVPESASLGLTYSRKPVVFTARWNYRGLERRGLVGSTLPGGFNYLLPFPSVDLSFEYQISRRVSIFGSSRNIFNTGRLFQRWTEASPEYSRYYRSSPVGVQSAIGIKGTF